MVDASRRGFFRGRPRPQAEIRPPWALAEAAFVTACTRCGDCLAACPERILVAGDGGYPTVAFGNGECTFCSACVDACRPGALQRAGDAAPWSLTAVAGPGCLPRKGIECRVCGDFCVVRAIRFTPRIGGSPMPAIDSERCTGCGACVAPCPAAAMTVAPVAAG